MNIGNIIFKLREDRGWTQEQTAGLLGISRAALSHYEKNRREPDTETLSKFADLFHVSVDYLVGRTAVPHVTLDEPVREFVDQLELSEEEILSKFELTIDGVKLSPEESRNFIAFVRAARNMK
ncbi:helix-turn-helix domain-containing protein [Paenibacillus sacheonensis]|uniref:Helix-turn-helix domain-containing protein n=1 Tax=Paenibacillus sacheonensis TaxID=742054 RepID=A0A7X4YP20_9BACL|nr:helix-turn-helix transcriptional regulator [Paenibacillus sacheonensis]MBM7567309.1 transcriptional regulator with XRE-family HTH domain [Paenibacillus sacheonensis]NBC69907.1 helix-turn-helix domain-containing protein [Paenibacillus sacheonensis]